MKGKKKRVESDRFDDENSLDESDELEQLFAVMEPANRPAASSQSQRQSNWRSVEEYMEARRLQSELTDEFLLEDE